MRDRPGEIKDHPHQRSLWFTHGSVNGIEFWTEQGEKSRHDQDICNHENRRRKVRGNRRPQRFALPDGHEY